MSIELAEAHIIATQMQELVAGRTIQRHALQNTDRMARIGFINRDPGAFEALDGRRVREVCSRGNTVLARLDHGMNLVIFPEYGGVVSWRPPGGAPPTRWHLGLDFEDGSGLNVCLMGMGGFMVLSDGELTGSYIYKRDFLGAPDPRDPLAYHAGVFDEALRGETRMLKAVLVGKDAIVVGLGNAAFQDIAWRARVHPKHKVSDLGAVQRKALYRALRTVIDQSIKKGGKVGFADLRGKPGRYKPACGPAAAALPCPRCASAFAKVAVGGGPSYYCPGCQGEPQDRLPTARRPRGKITPPAG
jgi:formamidopyrimidine-DNA glycosylase